MEEKKPRGRGPSLQGQLQRALLDAQALQQQTQRGESYISEMKLVTARIVTLQRLIRSKENSSLKPLKNENVRLKRDIASLKVEIETLKQRPAGPVAGRPQGVAPVSPQDDAVLAKMLADAENFGKESKVEVVGRPQGVEPRTPAPRVPTPSKGLLFPPELLTREQVPLTPPRVEETLSASLAVPRPVITPGEVEKKAIAASCSQFNDERTQANVDRITREARRNAPKSQVQAIEWSVADEELVRERHRKAVERLEQLRARKHEEIM